MAKGNADGEIRIETAIDHKGFEAGCDALMNAINSLAKKTKTVNQAIRNTFKKPLEVKVDTNSASGKLSAIKERAKQVKDEVKKLESESKVQTPAVNESSSPLKTDDLKKQVNSIAANVEKLEPSFQKAMAGGESAIDAFNSKTELLKSPIAGLKAKLEEIGKTKYPTAEYAKLNGEIDKVYQKIQLLVDKQEKMQATGVGENSQSWKSLQYDLELTGAKYDELLAKRKAMETSGSAFQLGSSTEQFSQLSSTLSSAVSQIQNMRSKVQQTNSEWAKMPTFSNTIKSAFQNTANTIKSAFNGISTVIKHPLQAADRLFGSIIQKSGRLVSTLARVSLTTAVNGAKKLGSFIKSAASSMLRMVSGSKSMNGSFGNLISNAKKFALSLLGARGVWALLRKAVSAYMEQNQQLSNTLQGCWSGIGNILGPIIEKIVNLVAQAVSFVLQFLKLFGVVGKSTTKAIGGAGSAAKKETDKLKRQLASFDELNVLSDSKSGSGGGGGSGSGAGTLPDVEVPDWAKLIAEQLKAGDWAGAATTLADQLNKMVDDVDWTGLGDKIGYYMNAVLTFLATFIKKFDWKNLGAHFGEMMNHILDGVDWENLGVVLTAKWAIILKTLDGFFEKLDGKSVSKALTDFMNGTVNAADWAGTAGSLAKNLSRVISEIDFGAISESLSRQFRTVLQTMIAAVENFDWAMLGKKIADFINGIDWKGIISDTATLIGKVTEGALDTLLGFVENIDWSKLGDDLWSGLESLVKDIDWNGLISKAFELLGAAVGGISALVASFCKKLWESLKTGFENMKKTYFEPYMNDMGEMTIEGFFKGIGDMFRDIGTWIKDHIFQPFIDGFKKAFGIASPAKEMVPLGGYIVDGLKQGIGNVWEKIKEKFTALWTNINAWFTTMKERFKTFGTKIIENLSSGIGNIWTKIRERFSACKESLTTWFTTMKERFKSFGSSTITNLYNGIGGIWGKISGRFSTFWGRLKDWFATIKARFKDSGRSMITNFYHGFGNIWNTVRGKFTSFWSSLKSYLGSKMLKLGVTWDTTSTLGRALTKIGLQGMPKLSFYAKGGIVDRPTLAMVGEAGKEAVIPLQRNTGWMKTMAQAIASEIKSSTFSLQNLVGKNAFEISFPSDISNGLLSLSDALNAVANSPIFRSPAIANGVIPYKTAATATEYDSKIGQTIENANTELGSVVIQAVSNATASIVNAIQDFSGTTVNLDSDSLTTSIVNEINRRTRMSGKSPLLI